MTRIKTLQMAIERDEWIGLAVNSVVNDVDDDALLISAAIALHRRKLR